jgi:hypothetical protein
MVAVIISILTIASIGWMIAKLIIMSINYFLPVFFEKYYRYLKLLYFIIPMLFFLIAISTLRSLMSGHC